jgi:hypothetical protein
MRMAACPLSCFLFAFFALDWDLSLLGCWGDLTISNDSSTLLVVQRVLFPKSNGSV